MIDGGWAEKCWRHEQHGLLGLSAEEELVREGGWAVRCWAELEHGEEITAAQVR